MALPSEDAVGNWSSSRNSHWRKSQHHLLWFWYSGSQENSRGCCYKINASCFESAAEISALPLFVLAKRAPLCPGFNLAAGDDYPVPTPYSVDIISQPSQTSMQPGGCRLCVMFCPLNAANTQPRTNTCKCSLCFTPLSCRTEGNISSYFFICLLHKYTCSISAVWTEHEHTRSTSEGKGSRRKENTPSVQSWRQRPRRVPIVNVTENTDVNPPAAEAHHLIPYRTAINYIFYYAW